MDGQEKHKNGVENGETSDLTSIPKTQTAAAAAERKQLLWDSLEKIYLSPEDPGSLGGVEQLYKSARERQLPGLTRNAVEEFLNGVPAYSLHRVARKKFPRLRTYAQGIDDQWQADLVDMGVQFARANRGMRYLLTCIDVFSKYAWVVPVKQKSSQAMKMAFEELFKQATGRVPHRLQTDKGKEFLNGPVQRLLSEDFKVHHYYSWSDKKAAIVERFNRTLKEHMWRYFTQEQTNRYLEVLPKLVNAYNHRVHRSIGMSPHDVRKEDEQAIAKRLYGVRSGGSTSGKKVENPAPKRRQPKRQALGLPGGAAGAGAGAGSHPASNQAHPASSPPPPPPVMMPVANDDDDDDANESDKEKLRTLGDVGASNGGMVRISNLKGLFEKGYMPNWSEEDFRVREAVYHPNLNSTSSRKPPASGKKVSSSSNNNNNNNIVYKLEDKEGESIQGTWYQKEIQPIRSNRYLIERVIRRRPIKKTITGSSTDKNERECLVKWKGWPNKYNTWIPESDLTSARNIRS